jgi:hypothetical protein
MAPMESSSRFSYTVPFRGVAVQVAFEKANFETKFSLDGFKG